MNSITKRAWLGELRNPSYEPCFGAMHKGGKEYCPMGLLAKAAGCDWMEAGDAEDGLAPIGIGGDMEDSGQVRLNGCQLEFVGLDSCVQDFISNNFDSGVWTFLDVANWVEDNIIPSED